MKTKEERQEERHQRRKNRRAALRAKVRGISRPLDEDDREALALLLKRTGEILSDAEVTDEERAEWFELARDFGEARKNTPDLRGLAEREQG